MSNYVIYLRKSRSDQEMESRGEGETLARHEKTLTELAHKLKLPIADIYREVVSGETIASRPMMTKLLAEVEQGVWDGVLVMEVERLARGDTIDQGIVAQAFKFSDTKIITPVKTYDPANEFDEEYFEFGLFMSRREYKTINRRLQRGRIMSVKEGRYVGNIPPYGYERVKVEGDKGFTLKPIPAQADIVKMIFSLYAGKNGKAIGVSVIARKLNDLKVPTIKGGDWTTATIQSILENPVYIGKVRWNARKVVKKSVEGSVIKQRPRTKDYLVVDGLHKPIIDEDLFYAVAERRKKNPPMPIGLLKTVQNPLSGLVFCSKCGRRMSRRPYPGHKDMLICQHTSCPTVASNLEVVEREVLKAISGILEELKAKSTINSVPNVELLNSKKSILAAKEKELDELIRGKDKIYELLERGIYDELTFADRLAKNKEIIESTQVIIAQLKREIESEENKENNLKTFVPRCETLLSTYDKLTPEEKNVILKEIIEKIIYTKNERNKHGQADAPNFELSIYPKLYL